VTLAHPVASSIAFLENDAVLGDLDDHFEGNFLGEDTLLALAHAHGCSTAAIGKGRCHRRWSSRLTVAVSIGTRRAARSPTAGKDWMPRGLS
jgi:hypothetical protein